MEKSARRLSTWLNVLQWITENKYEVIEEAEKALSELKANSQEPETKVQLKGTGKTPARDLVAHYCDVFKGRYGCNPTITGRAAGQLKNLAKSVPAERLCELLTEFLRMNTQYFVMKRHSVDCFVTGLNEVTVAAGSGRVVTRKQAQEIESLDSSLRAAKEYIEDGR